MTIPVGRLVALIGPNGAGKTTLLRCLLGLQPVTSGEIRIFGETDFARVLPRVGYVPQRINLERSFVLSVREFLALRTPATRSWLWRPHRQTDQQLRQALASLGVEALLHQPLAQLSGGQLQRVLIAFALLGKPDLLLLDEPTADVQQRHGLTAVLVSHDLSMVNRHAHWVYALNAEVCCEGPPDLVMNADSLKRAYGMHVSSYHHAH
jgi:ABC-type Mn2+/Zn2+ transport system ATPase subunit